MSSLVLPLQSDLLSERLYVDGGWIESSGGDLLDVTDPATGALVARVANGTPEDARRAVVAAHRAFPAWASQTAIERSRTLRRWFDLIVENVDELAAILVAEQGKPLAEARGEILYGAGFVEWYAEECKRAYGEIVPTNVHGRRISVLRQPLGVCVAITPWNFPSAMILRKAGPALAVGCTMVVKPASETPLSALALAELADRAGIPAGVFNLVHGPPEEIGSALIDSPEVRKLTFTGSTEVGKHLLARCAHSVKRVSLELGGNAPLIIFDDADVEAAVAGAVAAKFRNAGQTCVCANRILVQHNVHDEFLDRFIEAVRTLRVGNGFEEGVEQGPLINEAAVDKVQAHIADATAKGARIRLGGGRHTLGGTFFEPTVIDNATADMVIAHEETFGPVAPVFRFVDENHAVELANATESGLAAYFYTRDVGRATRITESLEFGVVAINTGTFSYEGAPFGGFKQSGLGREGSAHGLDDFLEIKYVCLEGV